MEIKRSGSQPSGKGPAEWFTGMVRIDPLFGPPDPARTTGASVTFEPGARTAWHTHPLGQTLIVTAGCGWVQRWGGPIEEIRPGDVIWFSPGEKHWHGHDAYRHSGEARRQGCRLDGAGQRRTISQVRAMPHVIVKLYPGRSELQKTRLAEEIVKSVMAAVECGEKSVSVSIEEVRPEEWANKVYEPDILNNWEKLYKKPGYKP